MIVTTLAAALVATASAPGGACAAGEPRDHAPITDPADTAGFSAEVLEVVPSVAGEGLATRLLRITIEPGGSLAAHTHDSFTGMAIVEAGEAREYRSDCTAPQIRRPGDVVPETEGLTHAWENTGDEDLVALVAHTVVVEED